MSREEASAAVAFGQLLWRCRRASGLSQEELAERAGVGVRTICDLERGRRTRPYRHTVGSLAEALGLQESQLDEFVRLSRQPAAGLHALRRETLDGHHAVIPAQLPAPPETAGAGGREVPVPRELPAAVAGFTGRDSELAALDALLGTPPVGSPVTMLITAIGGTAGVGKTALAVQWAHHVAELFPDGQLYVNLRGYDPGQPLPAEAALAGLLRALGVPGQDIPPGEDERAARYRSVLAGRRMLVVLDNARDADQVRPLLPGTPGSAAVVTSRDALAGLVARDGARRLDLDLLPLTDAVRLLRTLIGGRIDAEPEVAGALAARCCRLPLALRVAAEMAAARPGASLASLAAELADQQLRLELLDAGGDPGTAVRAVFSWSLRYLDSGPARAFRLVGVHPGPDLDVYAAAALTGSDLRHARRLLDQLARAHLIQNAGPCRYAMHDLLRDYARELAALDAGDDGQRAALTRLFDYYLHAAAAAVNALYPAAQCCLPAPDPPDPPAPPVSDPAAAQAWLDTELASLIAVTAHAAAHGWPSHATQLAAALFCYLDTGGHYCEASAICTHACHAARQAGDRAAEARALINLGTAGWRQGQYEPATSHLQQALSLYLQIGDKAGQARALGNLGTVALQRSRFSQATCYHLQALALYRQTGDRAGEASALGNVAIADLVLARYQQAAAHLQEALGIHRQIGNAVGESYALAHLGDLDLRQGRYQQAAGHLREAHFLCRQTGDRACEAHVLGSFGDLDLLLGSHDQAAGHHRRALAIRREIGDRSGEADSLNGLGNVLMATGRAAAARSAYEEALELASQLREPYSQACAHEGLGSAYHATGDSGRSRCHWQQALMFYSELGVPAADQVRARLATTDELDVKL